MAASQIEQRLGDGKCETGSRCEENVPGILPPAHPIRGSALLLFTGAHSGRESALGFQFPLAFNSIESFQVLFQETLFVICVLIILVTEQGLNHGVGFVHDSRTSSPPVSASHSTNSETGMLVLITM